MTQDMFHKLVHFVMNSPAHPPEGLFAGGMDDWHARARLAHFLGMEGIDQTESAVELFKSVVEEEIDENRSEDVEEKAFAMQRLSSLEREMGKMDAALTYINLAIELAESTDFLYKYILRGELWADRWNLMHKMDMTKDAESEVDERLEAFEDIPAHHNSYLYYGYRFKAQLAAERGVTLVAKDYMHMALHAMDVPEKNKAALKKAFAAKHDNASWILQEVDRATPNPDSLHWDI